MMLMLAMVLATVMKIVLAMMLAKMLKRPRSSPGNLIIEISLLLETPLPSLTPCPTQISMVQSRIFE